MCFADLRGLASDARRANPPGQGQDSDGDRGRQGSPAASPRGWRHCKRRRRVDN